MSVSAVPWATRMFGFAVQNGDPCTIAVTDLVAPGLRRNPRRAHLLVSEMLGKHIPARPAAVIDASHRLGAQIRNILDGEADVVGMAETATGLGHCVADSLDAPLYLHTSRRSAPAVGIYASFQESHSHAIDHTLQPSRADLFSSPTLVIVDDEISTGATALAAIRVLHRLRPRQQYIVASLVDVREDSHVEAVAQTARDLRVTIDHVSLATGRVHLPANLIEEVNALAAPQMNIAMNARRGRSEVLSMTWPPSVPDGGRHGIRREDRARFDTALHDIVGQLYPHLQQSRPVLLVGHEEFMYLPLRTAEALATHGFNVLFQSTTRSPAYVVDSPGYPLRRGFQFSACESHEPQPRYLYNGWPSSEGGADPQLVLMVDGAASTDRLTGSGGPVDVLTGAGYDVLVVIIPSPDWATLAEHRGGRAG